MQSINFCSTKYSRLEISPKQISYYHFIQLFSPEGNLLAYLTPSNQSYFEKSWKHLKQKNTFFWWRFAQIQPCFC
jgi:hypothetical protein